MTAKQGHTYRDNRTGSKVMAMELGETVRVREVITDEPWLGREYVAHVDWLDPLPMKYYGGDVPA